MHDQREFNNALIAEFREHSGKLSGQLANSAILLLTTVGAKSGQERVAPLGYAKDGERFVVIAANAGAPAHPDWYFNLLASPAVTIEVGPERFSALAQVAEGDERERLAALIPWFGAQQEKTSRVIPVVTFERAR